MHNTGTVQRLRTRNHVLLEAKWIKCGRSPPSPQQRVTSAVVPKRSNSLVQTLKGMVNVFPKNRLPKFAFNDDLEKEVMEGVLR